MCSGLGTLERQNNTAREEEEETEVENIVSRKLNIVLKILNRKCCIESIVLKILCGKYCIVNIVPRT